MKMLSSIGGYSKVVGSFSRELLARFAALPSALKQETNMEEKAAPYQKIANIMRFCVISGMVPIILLGNECTRPYYLTYAFDIWRWRGVEKLIRAIGSY